METKTLLLWLFLCPYRVSTTQNSTNAPTSPSSSSTTSPSPPKSPSSPSSTSPGQCDCLNTMKLDTDLVEIKTSLEATMDQVSNLDITVHEYSYRLDDIRNEVVNVDCGCTNETDLKALEIETHSKLDEVLVILNASNTCECVDGMKLESDHVGILAKLDKLQNKSNEIQEDVKTCVSDGTEIKTKLDLILANRTEESTNTECAKEGQLAAVHDEIMIELGMIRSLLSSKSSGEDTNCSCIKGLEADSSQIKARLDEILEMLNGQSSQCENELNISTINEKLDIIIESTKNVNTSDCECVSLGQMEGMVYQLCQAGKGKRNRRQKKTHPWEIPEKDIEELLSDQKSCITRAMVHLDGWFKNKAWRRMPNEVKKILITLYCKIGWKEMQTMTKMKTQLEKGSWKDAASRLKKTDWYKRDPESGEDLVKRLEEVKEKMAKN